MEGFRKYINNYVRLENDTFKELSDIFKKSLLNKKELFTKEGEYAKHIGFLEKGIIRSFIRTNDGKEYTKQFFVAPTFIGAYSSLLTHQPNRIIQEAQTKCSLWKADYSKIVMLYDKHHEIERIGRKIAEFYYLEKEQSIIEFATLDATKRYALFKNRFPNIESKIPQYHIASYLGITATQLSRIRKNIESS